MRTFHTGGVAGLSSVIDNKKSENSGVVSFRDIVTLSINGKDTVVSQGGKVIVGDNEYEVDPGSVIMVKEGQKLKKVQFL